MPIQSPVRYVSRCVTSGLLVAASFGVPAAAASVAMPGQVLDSMRAQALVAPSEKASLSPAQRKVDSQIRRSAWPEAMPRARTIGSLIAPDVPWHQAGRSHVIVTVTGTTSPDTVALQAAGLEIEIVSDHFGLVQGWIGDGAVPALADLPIVQSISPAWPAEHRVGSVTSEGDHTSRADIVRQFGYDGTGVVVGVISDGIDSLAVSQATGDLPSVTVPPDPRCRRGSGDEGTAILEIVHDLAPGAALLFSGPTTSLDMVDAIGCLTSAGADVIVDDVFFIAEPFFEDGPIAQAVRTAIQAGVSYHSSAGNDALEHMEMDYRASPATSYHDFLGGPTDNTDSILLQPGTTLTCVLQWNDPFGGSANDYDLYILDASPNVVASSEGVQAGSGDPIEIAGVVNPTGVPLIANVAINKFSGLPRRLEMFCRGSTIQEYTTSAGSIFGHPALPEVVAVGAIDQADPGHDDVETFSSRGPSVIQFPAFASRPKPDLAGFDGVSTTLTNVPGLSPFFGTSAAAPHSAAIAALLLSKSPHLTPAQVQSILTSTAVDIEAPGFDDAAGFGRIDALAAFNTLSLPTTTTSITTTSTSARPTTSTPVASTSSTVASTPTTLASTSSTTLPSCDATDCDGNACTVGDRCVAGVCQAGSMVTAGRAGTLVSQRTHDAAVACDSDRKRARPILKSLAHVVSLLGRADEASLSSEKKLRKKLSEAHRVEGQTVRQLQKVRGKLSSRCIASLALATTSTATALSCLP